MNQITQIFVTNDDGIEAPGLAALVECMSKYGEVTVIAPCSAMSGVGHAITMRNPIMVEESFKFGDIKAYSCCGTPADCVKFGLGNIFDKLPDLLVSGINHGSNASVNMIYSGTVAAAVEGALYGVKSIAFSSLNYNEEGDLTTAIYTVDKVVKAFIDKTIPRFSLLNVNVPIVSLNDFKGIKFCRQSLAQWKESFTEEINQEGKKLYWLTGEFICNDKELDTDIWALENNFASVVPVSLDLTNHLMLNQFLKSNTNEEFK